VKLPPGLVGLKKIEKPPNLSMKKHWPHQGQLITNIKIGRKGQFQTIQNRTNFEQESLEPAILCCRLRGTQLEFAGIDVMSYFGCMGAILVASM
jgi:hypothetical protein